MKLNKILMALSAMAIVGCSSEDFNDPSVAQAIDDSRLIQLDKNFILAGVGAEGTTTRTHWEQDAETKGLVNKFLPIYSSTATIGSATLNDLIDEKGWEAVGLCWLGQTPGAEVYTNYEFYHFGWLKKGETEADLENCNPVKLYNGAMYNEITPSAGTVGKEADETRFGFATGVTKDFLISELNYNSGVYKTDNKAIFRGKYIVYYPYNPDFKEAGAIPAVAKTSFEWDATASTGDTFESAWLGEATFRYSAPVDIEGGMNAANFGLYNLSTLVRLSVISDATLADKEVDQIVLYSESEKFVKQANLGADKIAAGKTGAELYTGETEGTKTIVTTFKNSTLPTLNTTAKTTKVKPYITVLPTTVDDLVALVHIKTKGWARVELPTTEFKAGNGQVINITVNESDVTSDIIATDATSLKAALTEAEGLASEDNPVTITVIGDITLTEDLTINQNGDRFITIEGGNIIVPQDKTLTLTSLKEMKSGIRVLGKSCCDGTNGGRLLVTGTDATLDATILNNVTLEKTEARVSSDTEYDTYNPQVTYQGNAAITIADDAKVTVQAGNVNVDRDVQHKGDIEIAKGAKVTVSKTGSLSFLGSTVDNYGTIEVKKAGQFYVKNANGSSVWSDGQNMTNHETGKFIHNVDAVVGTAVQNMKQEKDSEYRCRVDKQKALDDAYTQWTACNVIEMVAPTTPGNVVYDLAKACDHNGKPIDIEVNNTGSWTAFKDNHDDGKNIQIGNLTVKTPLDVDHKKSTKQRQLTVKGNMTVSATTSLSQSKKVTVTGDLAIDNRATLTYKGANKIVEGLKVDGNITVTDAKFDASDNGAILIECSNFSLINKDATYTLTEAKFGNRTAGDTNKSMTVKGTISNGKGCTFTIKAAAGENLLAWITCYKTDGEGTYDGTPSVIDPSAK